MAAVEVELVATETGQRAFRVKVSSDLRFGLKAVYDVIPSSSGLNTPRDVERAVAAAGGACAEYLCEKYDDDLDPSVCAKEAQLALIDLCKKLGKARKRK